MNTTIRRVIAMSLCILLSWSLVYADEDRKIADLAADQADLYVAPDGDDANPGTIEMPFQSLERARDAVYELNRQSRDDGPIVVMLRGGTYRPSLSVVFSDRDSGTKDSPIIYTAYPGEKPVLSGGRPVSGWQQHQDKTMVAKLPSQQNQYYRFRSIFFNGQRQIRSRHPNYDPQHPWVGGWAFIQSPVHRTARL